MENIVSLLEKALLSLDKQRLNDLISKVNVKESSIDIIEKYLVPALEKIGIGWQKGSVALSQIYMSGRICEEIVEKILPAKSPDRKNQPTMAIAVLEDYHLLGKRIVYSVLRSSGFELIDYGRKNVNDLINHAIEDNVMILLISTLMLPSALRIKEVRKKFNQLNKNIKIIVGGAPFIFDTELWKEVDADAMGINASESVKLISNIVGGYKNGK